MDSFELALKIPQFLSGTQRDDITPLQTHMLRGWQPNTLRSYNAAVKKFLVSYKSSNNRPFLLPASPDDIFQFCLRVGRSEGHQSDTSITAKTLSKYLSGLQAWHIFHQVKYPYHTRDVIKIMLRASERADALTTPKPKKSPVMIEHLMALHSALSNGKEEDVAVLDCAICAFWGLARIVEVTYDTKEGDPPWLNSILASDVIRPTGNLAHVIMLTRGAKTARAGVAQHILLNAQPNYLCPVKAVIRRAATAKSPTDSLFGYNRSDGSRVNLTRSMVINRCHQVWRRNSWQALSGHSFRVGGASLRAALGVSHEDIMRLGRWTSSCYQLYLQDYSHEDLRKTTMLLDMLNSSQSRDTV